MRLAAAAVAASPGAVNASHGQGVVSKGLEAVRVAGGADATGGAVEAGETGGLLRRAAAGAASDGEAAVLKGVEAAYGQRALLEGAVG